MKRIIYTLFVFFLVLAPSAYAGSVKIMDKDELKGMLSNSDLVVLDVRTGKDWSSSEYKIKGAVRLTSKDVDKIAMKYSKDSTLVLYCA